MQNSNRKRDTLRRKQQVVDSLWIDLVCENNYAFLLSQMRYKVLSECGDRWAAGHRIVIRLSASGRRYESEPGLGENKVTFVIGLTKEQAKEDLAKYELANQYDS